MALTDTACRAAKSRETEYKHSDGGGLYLLVKPSGSRLWNQAYRFSGKQKKASSARGIGDDALAVATCDVAMQFGAVGFNSLTLDARGGCADLALWL